MEKDKKSLLKEIGQTRSELEGMLSKLDPDRAIYSGWTIKELVCHITAWEVVIDKALIAFRKGDPPYFLHEQDFDIFNEEAVECRQGSSLEEVIQEWQDVRAALVKTIQKLKNEELETVMVLPWGSERSVAELIEIIGEHEAEHLTDVRKALT